MSSRLDALHAVFVSKHQFLLLTSRYRWTLVVCHRFIQADSFFFFRIEHFGKRDIDSIVNHLSDEQFSFRSACSHWESSYFFYWWLQGPLSIEWNSYVLIYFQENLSVNYCCNEFCMCYSRSWYAFFCVLQMVLISTAVTDLIIRVSTCGSSWGGVDTD